MQNFFTVNLAKFNEVFRRSKLIGEIDDLDEAILNSRIVVKVQRRFTPITGQSLSYSIKFPMTIAAPDNLDRIVTSGRFTFNNKICFLRNKLSSNKIELVNIDNEVEIDNIGEYNQDTGIVLLQGFNPTELEGGSSELKISVTPANQSTIRPLRNYVIQLDEDLSFAQSQIDYQNTVLTL